MRMWMIPTNTMCRSHLLGEHLEIHMFVGAINKSQNLAGYINGGLLEFRSLQSRHDELVREMTKRGYKHKSPLTEIMYKVENRKINIAENIEELRNRCDKCRKLMEVIC